MSEDAGVLEVAPKTALDDLLDQYRPHLSDILPATVGVERFMRWTLGYLRARSGEDDRFRAALATPNGQVSALVALMEGARLGLECGVTYHLVPFKGIFTGIVDYKGDVQLMANEGWTVVAQVVFEDDECKITDRTVKHVQDIKADRGQAIGAYAYAYRGRERSRVVWMDAEQIGKHRQLSHNAELWETWWESAWLKTVTHELRKWVAP